MRKADVHHLESLELKMVKILLRLVRQSKTKKRKKIQETGALSCTFLSHLPKSLHFVNPATTLSYQPEIYSYSTVVCKQKKYNYVTVKDYGSSILGRLTDIFKKAIEEVCCLFFP